VNQRNYTAPKMQTHSLSRTRYFCRLNIIISHPSGYKDWVISPHMLSLRGLTFPPTCVFLAVIQAWSYVAATAEEKLSLFLSTTPGRRTQAQREHLTTTCKRLVRFTLRLLCPAGKDLGMHGSRTFAVKLCTLYLHKYYKENIE
jgi:hypothetical protein